MPPSLAHASSEELQRRFLVPFIPVSAQRAPRASNPVDRYVPPGMPTALHRDLVFLVILLDRTRERPD